jgi:hypothetical protein
LVWLEACASHPPHTLQKKSMIFIEQELQILYLIRKNLENRMHTLPLICCQLWNFMRLSYCPVMEGIQVLVLLITEGVMCLIQCCPVALKKDVRFGF